MNSNSEYERYDGIGLAGLVKVGSLSAAELLEAAIERVEQRNPSINAVVNRMYDQAKAMIAAQLPSGPFSGLPYLLKDIGPLYAGTITTFGSSAFPKFIPDQEPNNEIPQASSVHGTFYDFISRRNRCTC